MFQDIEATFKDLCNYILFKFYSRAHKMKNDLRNRQIYGREKNSEEKTCNHRPIKYKYHRK